MILKALKSIWWISRVDQAWNNMSETSQSNWVSSFGIALLVKQDTSITLTCILVKKEAKKKFWDQVLFWKWLISLKMFIASFFDNLFNSPSLTVKLYERCLYAIGTTQKDRKGMPEMPIDRKMKTGDFGYLYANELDCCKWLERH